MRITILCSNNNHPVNEFLYRWIEKNRDSLEVSLVRTKKELTGGDILFLISCAEIVSASERATYKNCLVLHASKLPIGRGWSPHIWQIIEGAQEITVSLLEAEDRVDSGRIWYQKTLPVKEHALWDEINKDIFDAEIELLDFAIREFYTVIPKPQDALTEATNYPRRTPADSKLNPARSIESQFDLIRVCDPGRFPAFFELRGHEYKLTLEKIDE